MYAVVSDLHCHGYTLFARFGPDSVNTRLRMVLDELLRTARELKAAGGETLVIAGDVFHTRGTIDPEVLNPLREVIAEIVNMGIMVLIIPGNHDLKSAETEELASAVQNLEQVGLTGRGGCRVFNKPGYVGHTDGYLGFVPWRNTQAGLLDDLTDLANTPGLVLDQTDVFIHAGIDGVLSGMPANGLTHMKLASFGFRRIFAGHYHNHKDFGNGVISIGASTHHNWGDVGTKAGFLLVDPTSIKFRASQAPSFIDISDIAEDDMALAIPGNYVRWRGPALTEEQVNAFREELRAMGALGTSIECPRTTTALRMNAPRKVAMTTEQSIEAFIQAAPPTSTRVTPEEVLHRAIQILNEAQAVSS